MAETSSNPAETFAETARTLNRVLTQKAAIAQTPKEVVWTLNKAKLYRYTPVVPAEQRHAVPLLLVFALMNRPSIMDLRPGHSFVEFMVKQGYDVFLLDWGVPGLEDKDLRFDDYALDYIPRAVRKMKAITGTEEFTLLGWCIGSIITTIYAALRPDDGVRNLVLLTAPLDFSDKESLTFAKWTDQRYFDLDKILATFGNMPGEMIDYGAKALKPVENYVSSFLKLFDNVDDPRAVEAWHAMYTWVTDLVPIAGGAFRQLVDDLYRKNRLIQGELMIRGERVEPGRIKASLLNVIASGDHITPSCQSESIMSKVASTDKELLHVRGGHIGMMAGNQAGKHTWPQIDSWLAPRSR